MPFDSPSPPPAPDPNATARAQSTMNKETAIAQAGLNMTNQVTPQGSLTYSQIGKWEDGTPRYEATTALSPAEKAIQDLNTTTRTNLGNIGASASERIGGILGTPFNIEAARGEKLSDINRTFLDPQFQRERAGMETDLLNRGIRPGTEAYNNAVQQFEDNKSRAYNRMYLDSYGQANTAALTERNQPLNEVSALMSGSQVGQPNFVSTPSTGVSGTDVIGPTNAAYQGQLANWNAQNQSRNAMLGGIFGLGGTAAGGWASGGFKV